MKNLWSNQVTRQHFHSIFSLGLTLAVAISLATGGLMPSAQAQDSFFDWIGGESTATAHAEIRNGYRVQIAGWVNNKRDDGRHVVVRHRDQLMLVAEIYQNDRLITQSELRAKFKLTFEWRKLEPAAKIFIDPRSLQDLSESSRQEMDLYKAMTWRELKFKSSEFLTENTGSIEADFSQSAAEPYFEMNSSWVGSVRWAVVVHFQDRTSGRVFSVTSPDERKLSKPFPELKTVETDSVFLARKLADTGYPVLDRALSHLGLPYIWWAGSPSRMLGMTCSQLVSTAAFGKDLSTRAMVNMPGIKVTKVKRKRFYGIVNGQETELRYGDHVQPGDIIVYYFGKEERHAGMLAEDHGSREGTLDTKDMMIHATMSGVYSSRFLQKGLEYTELGDIFNDDSVDYGMKIISTGR